MSKCTAKYWYGHECFKEAAHEGPHETAVIWYGDVSRPCGNVNPTDNSLICGLTVLHSGNHEAKFGDFCTIEWRR